MFKCPEEFQFKKSVPIVVDGKKAHNLMMTS